MNRQCHTHARSSESGQLSHVAKDYMDAFFCIVEQMMNDMMRAALCGSISHNFIVQMIPHHEAAIGMSENILRYTTCMPVQTFAESVIGEQSESIAQMQSILQECSMQCNSEQDVRRYQCEADQVMNAMFEELSRMCASNRINADYLRAMMIHHRGGIALCECTLRYDLCPQLRTMLPEMIMSQRKDMQQMRRILRCAGCQ